LTPAIIDGLLQSLPEAMHTNTKNRHITNFSQFARYLQSLGFEAFVPEQAQKDRLYAPYIFSEEEMDRIFAQVDQRMIQRYREKPAELQYPLLLRLLYGCGLRLNEVLGLRAGDVDLDGGILLIRNAKGNKDRLIPMDPSLTEICRRYFAVTGKAEAPQDLLLPNDKGEQRSQVWARKWFLWCLKQAGIAVPDLPRYQRNICLHCLRHTFAVNSLRQQDLAGVDMYDAASLLATYLGHNKFQDTQRYLHMTAENSADIINKTSAYTQGLFPEVPQ